MSRRRTRNAYEPAPPKKKRRRGVNPHRLAREGDPNFHEAVAASRRQRRMDERNRLRELEEARDERVRILAVEAKAQAEAQTAKIEAVARTQPVDVPKVKREKKAKRPPQARTPAERRARRLAIRRQLRRMRRVLIVLCIAGTVALSYFIPRLAVFNVTHIDVVGSSAVADTVARKAIEPLLAHRTIYTVDTDRIVKTLENLPFVRGVEVQHHFPNSISVTLDEYEPLAFGIGANTGWLVASDGRVLSHARFADWAERVPVVRLSQDKIKPGDRVDNEPALRLLLAIPPTFPGNFQSIDRSAAGFVGQLTTGVIIKFGDERDFARKLTVAQRLLTFFGSTQVANVKYIDVSVPTRPAVGL